MPPYKFPTNKKFKQKTEELEDKIKKVDEKVIKATKDERLDEVIPLIEEMIVKLLAIVGMARFRSGFSGKIRDIMNDKEKKKV